MRVSVNARLFDPLWMLTRQWQFGEFQAEDAGTPVVTRVRATSAMLSRCHLGELPPNTQLQAPLYDPRRVPLEAMVERHRMRPADENDSRMVGLAIEAGLHFVRMLQMQPLSKNYRDKFVSRFSLQPAASLPPEAADPATARCLQSMAGRALDARRLAAMLRSGGATALAADPALGVVAADRAEVALAASAWLAWYDSLATEPENVSSDAWVADRLEYAVSVAARLSPQPMDEVTLSASEFDDGRLEWSSFDVNAEVNMGTSADHGAVSLVETTVPAPVSFRGTPAPRYWEMEDARIDYGSLQVGPTDLAHMLLIEYASSYGNDWFVVPFTLPVGSLTRVDSLVVTDSFGVRSLLRPIGDPSLPRPNWSMWQMAYRRYPGEDAIANPATNLFFLPPTTGQRLQGAALEDVLFMRDEMANLAWAIERSIESPLEQPMPRIERTEAPSDATTSAEAPPRYLLASTVPGHWVPLLPVQTHDPNGKVVSRLRRGALLQPDGSQNVHPALSEVLKAAGELLLYDEEVPREGQHVTRLRVVARWIDGSTWLWTAFRKQVGRGEGSSGLMFDRLERDGDD